MVLGYTVIEELPVGEEVFFLGGAGPQDLSPAPGCCWEARFWANVVERLGTIYCRVPVCGTEALLWMQSY